MTSTDRQLEANLRQAFRAFNRFMLLMWRLGMGGWVNFCPGGVGRIMVLTHKGRKTGRQRRTPLNYAVIEGEVYCTAGCGSAADWYRNIMADPAVELWLPDGWWQGMAEDVTDSAHAIDTLRQVLIASAFAGRAAGINPRTMTDEELAAATAGYRLIHIRRVAARTGPGGPGDLSWVWPVLAQVLVILLVLLLARPRKKRS